MIPANETRFRRWFPQPPARVWAAWTDPQRLDAWWGPDGFSTQTHRFDLRVGGEWVFTMSHPTHGAFPNRVRFQEIVPERLLRHQHVDEHEVELFRSRVDFEPAGGGTLVTLRSVFPSAEALRYVVEHHGAIEGGRQTLSRLERHLGRAPRVRVAAFMVSLDGFGAGPDQSLEDPLGKGGTRLAEWFYATRTFRSTVAGQGGGTTGVDDDYAARAMQGVGAWILGRNMFGPIRGPWPDESWRGWWGDEPPYGTDVFVLTHYARPPLRMEGGTTFHFVTDGIDAALARAREAAGDLDVRIGGGVATVRQYVEAGLVDEIHLAVAPVLLGRGEALYAGLDLPAHGFEVIEHAATDAALHVVLHKR